MGNNHQFIEPLHLLIALIDQEGGITRSVFAQAGVKTNFLRPKLGEALELMARVSGGNNGDIHVSNDLSRLLNITDKLAQKREDQYISSELFLVAALDDKGSVATLLKEAGATKDSLNMAIDNIRQIPTNIFRQFSGTKWFYIWNFRAGDFFVSKSFYLMMLLDEFYMITSLRPSSSISQLLYLSKYGN